MKDEVVFRRRQRLKYHFVNTSKVLLYGYQELSDAAKITYQVIDGFDWEDKETGDSKGYAFPATETIARIRGATDRTIRRHITELEQVGMLTRVRRRNKSSILYIEDVSEEETARYIELFVNSSTGGNGSSRQGGGVAVQKTTISPKNSSQKSTTDKNVHSRQAPETTKMSVLDEPNLNLGKEKEVLKKKKNVNVVQKTGRQGMQSMGQLMSTRKPSRQPQQGRGVHPKRKAKRDYLAQLLADEFDDSGGLGCYRKITDELPEPVVFQLLAEVKDSDRTGQVRSRPALFVAGAKRYADEHDIDLGFGKNDHIKSEDRPLTTGP